MYQMRQSWAKGGRARTGKNTLKLQNIAIFPLSDSKIHKKLYFQATRTTLQRSDSASDSDRATLRLCERLSSDYSDYKNRTIFHGVSKNRGKTLRKSPKNRTIFHGGRSTGCLRLSRRAIHSPAGRPKISPLACDLRPDGP